MKLTAEFDLDAMPSDQSIIDLVGRILRASDALSCSEIELSIEVRCQDCDAVGYLTEVLGKDTVEWVLNNLRRALASKQWVGSYDHWRCRQCHLIRTRQSLTS